MTESDHDTIQRNVLPNPDVTPIGLTTLDAKDPDTKYPPIRPLRPPTGAPNVLIVLKNSMKPNTCAALAETLKLNGYSTAQFGKCHEVPVWESSAIGPFDHWPTGDGGFHPRP